MALSRWIATSLVCCSLAACGSPKKNGNGDDVDAAPPPADACEGLLCHVEDCGSKGLSPTTLTGKVLAPNGTLPLFGVNVYVPLSDPGPLVDGVTCGRCDAGLQGGSIAQAITDEEGNFRLEGVPATSNVPVVIQTGKWRRQITISNVAACQETAVEATATTLPRTKAEGDIPKIAITTGNADALECLVRKLGIDDTEFGTDGSAARVHLYNGNGANQTAAGFPGGAFTFAAAPTLWNDRAKLDAYDISLFSCEGDHYPETKPQTALQNVHDYAGVGGRVFMSHWHNIWIGGSRDGSIVLPDWKATGTFNYGAPQDQENTIASIDETVDKGPQFATWMQNVGGSTTRGQIPISGARYTLASNDPTKSDRRVYLEPALSNNHVSVQDLQFTTPQDVPADQRCGKVVFSDMHVASGSSSNAGTPFPGGCATGELTPQEKALAFIFFDISSCVGVLQ